MSDQDKTPEWERLYGTLLASQIVWNNGTWRHPYSEEAARIADCLAGNKATLQKP